MSMLFRRNQNNAMPQEIMVANAGQMMLLWEVGRVLQLCVDLAKVKRDMGARYGSGSIDYAQSLADSDAREYLRNHSGEWIRHLEPFKAYQRLYRERIDKELPVHLDEIKEYLDAIDLDMDAFAGGQQDERQELLMQVAAYAGLRKAEISIGAAHASILPLGMPVRQEVMDLAVQMATIERDACARRMKLGAPVRQRLVEQGCASEGRQILLNAACTTRRDIPCAIWRPSLRK